jgi:hypothetical protein
MHTSFAWDARKGSWPYYREPGDLTVSPAAVRERRNARLAAAI